LNKDKFLKVVIIKKISQTNDYLFKSMQISKVRKLWHGMIGIVINLTS